MKPHIKVKRISAIFFCLLIFIPAAISAQTILGQYEDEAPLRTWNVLGVTTASQIGMGDTGFASVRDCSAALVNPSLLTKLPKYSAVLNAAYTMGHMHKFSFINTGVLLTEKNPALGIYSLNYFGIAMKHKGWGLAASTAILEDYDRPQVNSEIYFGDTLYKTFSFKQQGTLRVFNFALSRRINKWISAGIGINLLTGSFQKEWEDEWVISEISISDLKTLDFSGFYLNGGLLFDLTDKLAVGAVFRTPFTKNASGESLSENYSPGGNTFIQIRVNNESYFKQPLVIGAGVNYQLFNDLRIALDMSFFNWASYKVDYFGENWERDFKNILKINMGIEYESYIEIFGHTITVPMWLGFAHDPQPMRRPNSKYSYFSLGSGLRGKNISLDIGSMIGFESGSGNKLRSQKWTMTLGFHI